MIFRRQHTANFTTISNRLFDDTRLKADEVGILAYLLSRPHDWEVRRPALQRRWGIGREAMKRIMWNWIKTGWCLPVRSHAPNGTTFVIYDIRDMPGAEMTDDEVRNALSLVSSEAVADDSEVIHTPEGYGVSETGDPPTGYPSLADPHTADPYVANINILNTDSTKDESYQNSEREALRSREKHALHLAEFKRRWPTIATDDQSRVDSAWFALTETEGSEALASIPAFLADLKKHGRGKCCAGWKYLGEKRWTLLEQAQAATTNLQAYPRDSVEGKALLILHDIGAVGEFFRQINRRNEAGYYYRGTMDDRLRALAQAPKPDAWVQLNRQQAAAWETFLRERITANRQRKMSEHSRAPWPWPPSVDGKLYTSATGPPETYMSEEDANHI